MAEMANALAFSTYAHQSALYDTKDESDLRDRDSGVFLDDTEDQSLPLTPLSRQPSVTVKHSGSVKSAALSCSDSTLTDRRLRRPAELHLTSSPSSSRPKSELELRYDLIRNSSTQSRAALKSPTQLLKDRLNLSPTKGTHERELRVFTPPRPMLNGCVLPGPERQLEGFQGKDVRARTEKGRPAWWCKVDRVVVFDGVEGDKANPQEVKYKTRSSKGLSIARRRGDSEVVIIPLDCTHCQEMLNRQEWKYDVQVCKRSVCWECKERCMWEADQEAKRASRTGADVVELEKNRERADSVLQDEQTRDEELMRKVGIEMCPQSPVQAVGGIEERLEES